MKARGLVFFTFSRDSAVGSGLRDQKFAFDGTRTTVKLLLDEIVTKFQVDLSRMFIEVRPVVDQPLTTSATAPQPDPLVPATSLNNYARVDVKVVKNTQEHEQAKTAASLDQLESSLFAAASAKVGASAAGGAASGKGINVPRPAAQLRSSARQPSVAQMAMLEILDLPLGLSAADVDKHDAKECMLCEETIAKDNVCDTRCDCGKKSCGGCYGYCFEKTSPACPICGKTIQEDGATKRHRAE